MEHSYDTYLDILLMLMMFTTIPSRDVLCLTTRSLIPAHPGSSPPPPASRPRLAAPSGWFATRRRRNGE